MDSSTVAAIPGWPLLVVALVLGAMVGIWGLVFERLDAGHSPVPFERRRNAPWTMPAVLVLLLCYFSFCNVAANFFLSFVPEEALAPLSAVAEKDGDGKAHPAARLLKNGPVVAKAVCGVIVVVIIPIAEEFLFRLALQGWMEAAASRMRRRFPPLRRWLPAELLPIGIPTIFFAALHIRTVDKAYTWQYDLATILGAGVAGVATVALGLFLFRKHFGATLSDLGIVPRKLSSDIRLGVLAFLAIILPIFLMQAVLSSVLPKGVAADPITLFFFALALGWLYFRTHRIVPAVVLHMLLNVTSLAITLLSG